MDETIVGETLRVEHAQYPPSSSAFPQFIAPLGAQSGARAAHRLFIGLEGARALDEAAFELDRAKAAWIRVTGRPWPIATELQRALCHVDLDPQVTGFERGGRGPQLTALLAARAFEEGASHDSDEFTCGTASIWGAGHVDEAGGLVADPETIAASFQRFLEYCLIAASDRRHVFVAPSSARETLGLLVEQASREHRFEERELRGEAASRALLNEHVGARVCVAWVPEGAAALSIALEGFGLAWGSQHEHTPSASVTFSRGATLSGRYEIVDELGAGGFAVVYAATDLQVSRHVAVKVIDLSRAGRGAERDAFIKRFEREAKLAASVKHPCIVEVYDYGVAENEVPYMVMEMLEGHDLDHHLAERGPMPAEKLLPLFISALEGLGFAHEVGIVHKDLKPSNLFLKFPGSRREQLCILDFGVARVHTSASAKLTRTDNVLGTPRYMAPEYSTNQTVTPALDVYQMGLILVECLSGRSVVDHPEPMAAMFQHVRGELPIPKLLLESQLGPILERALSVEHTERYQDGFELADALRAVDPSTIPRVGPTTPVVSLSSLDALPRSPVSTGRIAMDPTIDAPSVRVANVDRTDPARPISREIANLVEPPEVRKAKAPETLELEADDSHERIYEYRSSMGYVALVVGLLIALVATVGAFVYYRQEQARLAGMERPDVEVVTDYDRRLAALRERVKPLEERLRAGEVAAVIAEIKEIDTIEDVRLTPAEVAEVKRIFDLAEAERPNLEILEKAEAHARERNHRAALLVYEQIPRKSIFRESERATALRDAAIVELRVEVNALMATGDDKKALSILNDLLRLNPNQPDLKVQVDALKGRFDAIGVED